MRSAMSFFISGMLAGLQTFGGDMKIHIHEQRRDG
jgi:hypothetical protein